MDANNKLSQNVTVIGLGSMGYGIASSALRGAYSMGKWHQPQPGSPISE